jgi:hypothetical protein
MNAFIKERAVPVPVRDSFPPAPTVVLFLEGASGGVLRNAVSALLGAGRSVWVFATTPHRP